MQKYLINPNQKIAKINKDIYGTFSEHLGRCIYEGTYVGENSPIPNVNGMRKDVVDALKEMGIPVLRWPGGCFADEYHWKDGIGPKESRKKMINTHWGGLVEDNSFGTHEFFELCDQLGCDAYVNGNLGSGTVQEMSEWIEYMTFDGVSPMAELRKQNGREKPWRLKYFAVGNENWGCGGNMMPHYYADEYRRYQVYVRNYDWKNPIYKIACGPNAFDFDWTDEVMHYAGNKMNGLSLHYYTIPTGDWGHKGAALTYSDNEYYSTIKNAYKMEELVRRHTEVMNRHDPEKRVDLIVDEWGTWYDVEEGTNPGFLYQQSTMRDALVAGLTLNIFNKHCDRVRMANIAQTVNVLQAVILTDGENIVLTPTYHIFKMYKAHAENTLLGSFLTTDYLEDKVTPVLTESASVKEDGTIISTVSNASLTDAQEIKCQIADANVSSVVAEIVSGNARDYNDFGKAPSVFTKEFTDFTLTNDGFVANIPPCSVVKFIIK